MLSQVVSLKEIYLPPQVGLDSNREYNQDDDLTHGNHDPPVHSVEYQCVDELSRPTVTLGY